MGGNLEWGVRNAISTQVGEALNAQQLAAHDAVKHAHHQIKLTAAPASGGNAWALLPRDVRHALRDAVQQGDSVRRAVADLQAVLVRRFLRLCSQKDGHEEPDGALKDALRVVRGAASREVVRRKALCAALHDAQYKAADGVLGRIPVHKSFWGPSKLWWCCRVMLCASDVYVRALLEDSFWSG